MTAASPRRARRYFPAADHVTAAWCSAVAVAATLLACFASQDGTFRPSVLLKITPGDPLARLARASDPGFQFANRADHYDGSYYYAIARDPMARGDVHGLIDQPAYRYGHPLFGWLGTLFSGGQPVLIPWALLCASLLGMALAGWALSRLATALGATPWLGLTVVLLPGLLSASSVLTPEPVCAGLVLCSLLAWHHGRWALAALPLALAALGKEQFVLVPVALALHEALRAVQRRAPVGQLTAKAGALACGPIVLVAWYLWVHHRLGAWPWKGQAGGNITWPLAGWLKTLQVAHNFTIGGSFEQVQIGAISPPLLTALAVLFAAAAVRAVRVRTILDLPLLMMIAFALCQDWRTLVFAHELLRTPAVAAILAVAVLLLPRHQKSIDHGTVEADR